MGRMLLIAAASTLLAATRLMAQVDSSLDTVVIVESSTRMYQGQLVDFFVLDIGEARLLFVEDTAYAMLVGTESNGDTTLLPEPKVWMKTKAPEPGDLWPGMIPTGTDLFTNEIIDDTIQVAVEGGIFPVFKIHCYDLSGAFLGQKWWSDGVGLVGWDLQLCNKHDRLELVEYSVAPSTDFWPHAEGDTWVYRSISSVSYSDAEELTPTVDGRPDDWVGHPSVISDPPDDSFLVSGTDIADVYAAADANNVYLMVTFWDGSPDTAWAADAEPAYAIVVDQQEGGMLWGYTITYEPGPVSEWHATGVNLSDTGIEVAADVALEISIPRTNLGIFHWELPRLQVIADSGNYDLSCDNDVRLGSCPIVMPGDVTGDFNRTAADIVYLVNFVLKGGPTPIPCKAAGDLNCNLTVGTSDIIYLVNRIFKAGPEPCDVCALIPGSWSCP